MVIQDIAIVGRNGITRSTDYTVPINVGKVKISKELDSRCEILSAHPAYLQSAFQALA